MSIHAKWSRQWLSFGHLQSLPKDSADRLRDAHSGYANGLSSGQETGQPGSQLVSFYASPFITGPDPDRQLRYPKLCTPSICKLINGWRPFLLGRPYTGVGHLCPLPCTMMLSRCPTVLACLWCLLLWQLQAHVTHLVDDVPQDANVAHDSSSKGF
jgi:hypothetical protein